MWSSGSMPASANEVARAGKASRVIEAGTVDIHLVPWRRAHQAHPSRFPGTEPPLDLNPGKPGGVVAGEEVLALRARVEDLTKSIDQRSFEAHQEGYRAGEAAARKALEQETRAAIEAMTAAIGEAASLRAATIRHAEADTVRLAIEIARRVLHREISVDPSALEALIRAALGKLQNQEILRVRVHPGQEQLVRACLDEAGRGKAVEVTPDAGLSRGAASFEMVRGSLDASVDAQLAEIERGLADELRTRS